MTNLTEDARNYITTHQEFFCTTGLGAAFKTFSLTLALPLSITAILGNVLIILALRKVSSLHPPSKFLLGSLACTDLGVGLILHPIRSGFFLFPDHSEDCHYFWILFNITGFVFGGVSLLTMTAISVDRLLALSMGLRYKQLVTVRRVRVLVITFWIFCTFGSITVLHSLRLTLGIGCAAFLPCTIISTFCYIKIYRTLRFSHAQVLSQSHQGQKNREGTPLNKARYKKTVSTVLWAHISLLACSLPFGSLVSFASITGSVDPAAQSFKVIVSLAVTLMLSNSTLNPFLYCWKMTEMRQAVKDTIRQFCC